MVRLELHRLQT